MIHVQFGFQFFYILFCCIFTSAFTCQVYLRIKNRLWFLKVLWLGLKTVTLHAENLCLPIGFKCDAKGPLQASICKCLGARNLFQYFHDPLHRGTDAKGHNVFISGQNGSGAENWLQTASQNPGSKLVHVGFQIICKPYTVSAPCSYTILKMK